MNPTKEKKEKIAKKKRMASAGRRSSARKPGSVQSGSIEKKPSLLLLSVIASRCSFAVGPTNG